MSETFVIKPTLSKPQQHLRWDGLAGASQSLMIARAIQQADGFFLVITPDSSTANQLESEINFFLTKKSAISIRQFPDWETLPYDNFSPHEDIVSERIATLYALRHEPFRALIVPLATLMHRLAPVAYIDGLSFCFSIGDIIDFNALPERLLKHGYQRVSQVLTHGEYSIRGSIIDIFPMGTDLPIRIDCFDSEVEQLKTFDPDTQRSIASCQQIRILPAREFPLTEEAITRFRRQWRERFTGNPLHSPTYESISNQQTPMGIEYYLALFFEKTGTLFDYLPQNTHIIRVGDMQEPASLFLTELEKRYEQLRYDVTHPLLPPSSIAMNYDEFLTHTKPYPQIYLQCGSNKHRIDHTFLPLPEVAINHKLEAPLRKLKLFSEQKVKKLLIVAESSGRREIILQLFQRHKMPIAEVSSWEDFLTNKASVTITIGPLRQGFMNEALDIGVVTENELFTHTINPTSVKKNRAPNSDFLIRDLSELKTGQAVVHLQHGIGLYQGLERIHTNGITNEFITLKYSGNAKIYVPITALGLLSRYGGDPQTQPPLDKLGSEKWSKTKQKAIDKIHDVAVELLEVYAKRQASQGHPFLIDAVAYERFSSQFSFDLTPDQQNAVTQVFEDMQSKRCMDRLICGDVGFGKTEVALRASFIAAYAGKQVACLVPTTLLAGQHFQTFSDRFADFPIRVEQLSRFRSAREQKVIRQDLAAGKIDIIIGTHRLLQNDIEFADLGLLIIDEEHRFGVKQKERIKSFRAHVDLLTLTATPIPRTLNLSMAGVRDISIIASPPAKRLSIKTFVIKRNTEMIREAVLREIMRGGQVFYLHNSVESIQHQAYELQKLLPEAAIRFAHGQLPERELEQTMSDFYHRRFNVLLCTTIIENGIDLPNANTILINKADHFGLAQLHQLRGRVGRSHHQAYAYLIVDNPKSITADAKRRLDAFSGMDDLGAGFRLAIHDLEIRGSGEILGHNQSGHIDTIGLTLYMELLEKTLKSLKSGQPANVSLDPEITTELNMNVTAIIPDDYLPDIHHRLQMYQRIAEAPQDALAEIQVEMIDRFGLLPSALKRLFKLTELKHIAKSLGITKLESHRRGGLVRFTEQPVVKIETLLHLIQNQPEIYQLSGPNQLTIRLETVDHDQQVAWVEDLLYKLRQDVPNTKDQRKQ